MERIILDTDIGSDVDDAFALALALHSPELRIDAVTTVYGDTALRARIAARLIQLAGVGDVPVYAGLGSPLLRKRPVVWFGHEGKGVPDLHLGMSGVRPGRAVEAIVSTVMSNPCEITVVAIGPLTNLAAALIVEPSLAERVKRIIVMGGAVGLGSAAPLVEAVEHNFKCDPEAAMIVLESGSPITLIGLDVTRRVFLERQHLRLMRDAGGRLGGVLADLVDEWWAVRAADRSNLHDPLALGVAIQPGFVTTRKMRVWVDYQSHDLAGAAIAREAEESPVSVAVDVEPDRFLAFMMARVCGSCPTPPACGDPVSVHKAPGMQPQT